MAIHYRNGVMVVNGPAAIRADLTGPMDAREEREPNVAVALSSPRFEPIVRDADSRPSVAYQKAPPPPLPATHHPIRLNNDKPNAQKKDPDSRTCMGRSIRKVPIGQIRRLPTTSAIQFSHPFVFGRCAQIQSACVTSPGLP